MTPFIRKEKPDLMKKVHDLPHKPGVYLMRDRLARVIYVGKARDLRKRVGQYFMPSRKMTADIKTRALLDSIWDFETHTVKSEPEALLLEGRLIKEYRPKYNVSFRDDKRFLLVKVDERETWPRFRLARIKKDDGARYFGPYANAGALRETIKFMRKKFGVLTFGRGRADRSGIEIFLLPGPLAAHAKLSAEQIPRARGAGVRAAGRRDAGIDRADRGRHARGGGEARFRARRATPHNGRGPAADHETEAAFHPAFVARDPSIPSPT